MATVAVVGTGALVARTIAFAGHADTPVVRRVV